MQTDSSPTAPLDPSTPPETALTVDEGESQNDLGLTIVESASGSDGPVSVSNEPVITPNEPTAEPATEPTGEVAIETAVEAATEEPVIAAVVDVGADAATEEQAPIASAAVDEEEAEPVANADSTVGTAEAADDAEAAADEHAMAAAVTPVSVVEAGGLQSGQLITGEVLSVDANEVVIQLPDERLGVIGRRHLTVDGKGDPPTVVKVGDLVEAAVLVREDRENRVVLSRTWAQKQRAWAAIEASVASGEPVNGAVIELVKGGLTVDIGVRAFLPASQVDLHHVDDLASMVGTDIACLVVEADRVTDKVVVSRRNWLRQVERRQANELAATLAPGQVHRGRVVTVTDFGAFVDIGGVRGLLHLSELSWNRVEKTSDVVSVGQEIDVQILSLKGGSKRISLSMRAVNPDPLVGILEGERLLGVVTRLVDFGAFVKVKDEVEGLVHVSELAEYRVHLPEEVVTPGDEVWVKVVRIDRKRRRVDLSVNQAVQY